MQWFGTNAQYLCIRNKNGSLMKKTSYNSSEVLNNYISSSDSLQTLKSLMEELGLEFEDAQIL